MIVLRDGEYLAKRVHVKCTGSTKKFGRGIMYATTDRLAYESDKHGLCFERPMGLFPVRDRHSLAKTAREQGAFAIRNNLGFSDFKNNGKHDFQIVWYEDSNRFEFNASIQKHNGERTRNLELYARLNELIFNLERHHYDGWTPYNGRGSNRIWHGGKHVDCAVVQPDKIPTYVDGRPLFNVFMPDLGEKINSGKFTFRNANIYLHNEASKESQKMTGETYEEQYRYAKNVLFLGERMDGNYHFETGLRTREQVLNIFKTTMAGLKEWQNWYKAAMSTTRRWIQECNGDKKQLATPCKFTEYYRKLFSKNKNPTELAKYFHKQACDYGILPDHLTLLTGNYEIMGRVIEIIGARYMNYQYVKEFELDTIATFEALKKHIKNGDDISAVEPNTSSYKLHLATNQVVDLRIKQFRKKLTEPL